MTSRESRIRALAEAYMPLVTRDRQHSILRSPEYARSALVLATEDILWLDRMKVPPESGACETCEGFGVHSVEWKWRTCLTCNGTGKVEQ